MPADAAISFNQIPANIRNPLFYAEVSNVAAGYFIQNNRVMIIGQSVNTIVEAPVVVPSVDWVKQTYGAGSQLAIMCEAFRNNNTFSELWVLPLNDVVGATAATTVLTLTGAPTQSGTINLYIGDTVLYCPVTQADSLTVIGDAIVTGVNAQKSLPVTAANVAGVVTFTAKNKGAVGNSLTIQTNYRGNLAGEKAIPGLTVTIAATSGGATNPNLANKLALIGHMDVAFYGHPYCDTSSLGAFESFLAARWHALVGQDGHAFTATRGTLSALQTLGLALNDPAHTVVGYEVESPSWELEVIGAFLGQASFSLSIDPARTLQTLVLDSIVPPKENDRFSLANRATLLNSGIATVKYVRGAAEIERAITTYQVNSYDQPDPSYLDVMTRTALTYIKKSVGYRITQKFPRSKLAPNGTIFGAGQAIVTPNDIKAELIAWYDELQFLGICVNPDGFAKNLLVSLNPVDPNRVDILLPPTIIANLVIAAVKVEFRLHG